MNVRQQKRLGLVLLCAFALGLSGNAGAEVKDEDAFEKVIINLDKNKIHTFQNEDGKKAFLNRFKEEAPKDAKDQTIFYGPDLVDALAELYASYNIGAVDAETIKRVVVASTLGHGAEIAGSFLKKGNHFLDKAISAGINGYLISRDMMKYSNIQALINKNKANAESMSSAKMKFLIGAALSSALLLYGKYDSTQKAEKIDFDGRTLTQDDYINKVVMVSGGTKLPIFIGTLIKYILKFQRYKLELSDLENYSNESYNTEEEAAPAQEQPAAAEQDAADELFAD